MTKDKPFIAENGEVRELDQSFAKAAKRGRPRLMEGDRKVRMNFMLDPDIAAALDKQPNKSAVVNDALRKALI